MHTIEATCIYSVRLQVMIKQKTESISGAFTCTNLHAQKVYLLHNSPKNIQQLIGYNIRYHHRDTAFYRDRAYGFNDLQIGLPKAFFLTNSVTLIIAFKGNHYAL